MGALDLHREQACALCPTAFRSIGGIGQIVVSLPAEYTFTFPAWLATSDRAVIPEILHLQLEKRGLLSKNSGASTVDYRVIETRENQTLAIATILQPEFPQQLAFERVKRFEPSAYTFALPQDRLVIWREQGRLTVAATRGREAVTVQVLGDSELSETAALELKCIAFQLESQVLCEGFSGSPCGANSLSRRASGFNGISV